MNAIRNLALLLVLVLTMHAHAQTNTAQPQPYSLMVIPFTQDDQTISTVLKDDTWRNMIREIQGILLENGLTVTDFLAVHKKYLQHTAMGDAAPSDLKADFLRFADPDVYVEVDMKIVPGANPGTNRARITLNAYMTATGLALSTTFCNGNYFQSDDALALARSAVKMCFGDFYGKLTQNLNQMAELGIPLEMRIEVADAADYDMNALVKSGAEETALTEACETWMQHCAVVKSYQARRGNTDRLKIFETVRMPLMNPETGRFSSPGDLSASFRKYCSQLTLSEFPGKKIRVKEKSISGSIYITLN